MYVQIEDVKNATILRIDGTTIFGRAGSENDIPVNDPSVSGRHARIFADGGQWFLEDLGSSNGTFVKGAKISAPVALSEGMRFSLCRHVFSVVEINSGVSEPATGEYDGATVAEPIWDGTSQPTAIEHVSTKPSRPRDRPKAPPIDRIPGEDRAPPAGDAAPSATRGKVKTKPHGEAGGQQSLVSYLLQAVPKAFAYYLVAVPLMLFNPMGAVRKSVETMAFTPFGRRELIAYALPPLLLGVAISSLGVIIVSIVSGTFGFGVLISPLISTAIAIVGAVITGYIFHPVLEWIVAKIFKGETDPTTRTNYFVTVYTALPLQYLAGGVAVLINLIPIPFVGVVPPLITMAASLILLYATYVWHQVFRVAKWWLYVLLVLMVLTVVGTAFNMVGAITADIAQLGSGGTGEVATLEGARGDAAATIEANIEALRQAGSLTPEIERAMRAQIEQARKAALSTPQGAADAAEAADEGGEAVDEARPVPAPGRKVIPDPKGVPPKAAAPEGAADGGEQGQSDYSRFVLRRDEIERLMEKDPTLITRPGVEKAYKELLTRSSKIKAKYKLKTGKKLTPEQIVENKISTRKREAETYEQTVELVDKVYTIITE